jgi:uncharacterized membrane protein YfcA
LSLIAFTRLSAVMAPRLPVRSHRAAAVAIGALTVAAYAICVRSLAPADFSLWCLLAILVASLVSSIAGFAFSAICGAMLFHLVDDPVRAVQIMMICSVGGQSLMVWALRREIPWRSLTVFLAGAAIGLPLGIFILLHTRPAVYGTAIGVALVLYAVFMMTRRPMILRRQNALFDAMAGFLGGVTGGAAAFPGAFVTIWCGFKGWPKEKQRALYQPFILIVQFAAIVVMALPGVMPHSRPPFDFSGIVYLPAMFVGATLGMACFNRLSDRQFSLAVNLALVVSGLSLLV